MTNPKTKPAHEVRLGSVKAAIWCNTTEKSGTFYSVTFSRSYKSGDAWKRSDSYPSTVARSYVVRMGQTLAQRLTEAGVARYVAIVEAPSAGMLDVTLNAGKTRDDLQKEITGWEHQNVGSGEFDPDVWTPFWIKDLSSLPNELRSHARDKYSYRELKDFADRIRDRLKQSHYVAQIDMVGNQDEQVWLSYSGQRLNQFGITPLSIVDHVQERNINIPGGQVELPDQNVVVRPTGEYASAADIGQTMMDVSSQGHALYLRDLVEITHGYEDPANVMNFRTIKVAKDNHSDAADDPEQQEKVPEKYDLQTGRAITISVRQVKGTNIADYDRDINTAIAGLKQQLPSDLRLERTSNEPEEVRNKISSFNRNLLEAIAIVVLVSLVFMEWRSALLVAVCIPVTVAFTLGLSQIVGIDLQQVSIAALIIALGLLVDAPVVAADAINRELAQGKPRHLAAWMGPQTGQCAAVDDSPLHRHSGPLWIEFTRVYREQPESLHSLQAQESLENQVMNVARGLYAEAGGKPAIVTAVFDDGLSLSKSDVKPLARAISTDPYRVFPSYLSGIDSPRIRSSNVCRARINWERPDATKISGARGFEL